MDIFYYRESVLAWRENREPSVGFVPTMGALHEGHLSLVEAARQIADIVAVSIFINPKQFNNHVDFDQYPKTIEQDLKLLQHAGVNVVFIPNAENLYGLEQPVVLDLGNLQSVYEGKFRPGHFYGVVDVLHQLFNCLKPNHVFLGLKDLQQCMVVNKLISTLHPGIHQHNLNTKREDSGLAMSSRNRRLSPNGKISAAEIFKVLTDLKSGYKAFSSMVGDALTRLNNAGIEVEYLDMVRLPDMNPEISVNDKKAIVFAGYVEGVRLIDNVLI